MATSKTKVKVINAFTDKNTGTLCLIGEELEYSQARAEELANGKFVKILNDAPKSTTKKTKDPKDQS